MMFWRRKRALFDAASVRRLMLLNLHGVTPMADASFQIVNDMIATVPLKATDQAGRAVTLPPDVTVSSSDAAVVTAAMGAFNAYVVLTPVLTAGTATITVTETTGMTATLAVEIVAPVVTALVFDTADTTFAAKPAA